MTIAKLLTDIKKNPIFFNLPEATLNRFFTEKNITVTEFSTDEIIHSSHSGEPRIGILLCGSARVHTANTEHSLLRTMQAGNMFGIANLYTAEEPFPSRIVAAEPCKILFLDCEAFKRLIEQEPVALRNYLTFQSQKIVYLNRKIMTFTAGSAEKKLALFLLENEVDGLVTLPCSMSRLSELLCIGRASLYRAIDQLAERGLIEKKEKSLRILDRTTLQQI